MGGSRFKIYPNHSNQFTPACQCSETEVTQIFIWDFVADTIMGNLMDWFYGQLVGFLGNFFAIMGMMVRT